MSNNSLRAIPYLKIRQRFTETSSLVAESGNCPAVIVNDLFIVDYILHFNKVVQWKKQTKPLTTNRFNCIYTSVNYIFMISLMYGMSLSSSFILSMSVSELCVLFCTAFASVLLLLLFIIYLKILLCLFIISSMSSSWFSFLSSSSQTSQGVQPKRFKTLPELVSLYLQPSQGLVTTLLYAVDREETAISDDRDYSGISR